MKTMETMQTALCLSSLISRILEAPLSTVAKFESKREKRLLLQRARKTAEWTSMSAKTERLIGRRRSWEIASFVFTIPTVQSRLTAFQEQTRQAKTSLFRPALVRERELAAVLYFKRQTAQSNSNVNSQATALTIADNLQATFAGAIQANSTITVADGSLVLGSTALTSTATELNLLDNVSGLVQADFTKLAAIDASAAEIDLLDGDTSVGGSITIADTDGFIVNDGGTMKTIPASDLKTYAGGGGGGSAADDSNLVLHMQVFA